MKALRPRLCLPCWESHGTMTGVDGVRVRLVEQRGFSRVLRDPANGGRTLSIMRDAFLIQGIGYEGLVEQRGFEPLTFPTDRDALPTEPRGGVWWSRGDSNP